jgi:hypothetical protein
MKLKKILYPILITITIQQTTATQTREIISVAQVLRNGPATPTDYLYDESDFSEIYSTDALTATGQRMMFNHGRWLRQQYPTIFQLTADDHPKHPPVFLSKIFSSSSKKSMQSAMAVQMGLHQPGEGGNVTAGEQFFKPPLDGMSYNFVNSSSLPHAFSGANFMSSVQDYRPFFEEQMMSSCPLLFGMHEEGQSLYENNYPIVFMDLREKMVNSEIEAKGYRYLGGWSDFNLRSYFEAAESHLAATGEYLPKLTKELYNDLRIYYSYSTEINFYSDELNYSSLWTSNILDEIFRVFEYSMEFPLRPQFFDRRALTLFSTSGKQLYAFMKLLGYSSKACILEIKNGTRKQFDSAEDINDPEYCQLYPQFGASLSFELARTPSNTTVNSNTYSMRALYNSVPINIPCEGQDKDFFCPYYTFKSYLFIHLIGFDHEPYCMKQNTAHQEVIDIQTYTKKEMNDFQLFRLSSLSAGLLFLIWLCTCCKADKKQQFMLNQEVFNFQQVEAERPRVIGEQPVQPQLSNRIQSGLSPQPRKFKHGDTLEFDDNENEKEKEDVRYETDEI